MSNYIEYPDRQEWLKSRNITLGASEISVACGVSNFKSIEELWEEKTAKRLPEDISDNPNVQYGTEAEEYLRGLFALKHRHEYSVEHHPYRVYHHPQYKFLTATLDGEILRLSDNARGVWECKTALIQSEKAYKQWQGCIPDAYYAQICEQLYVTGWEFIVLNAELRFPDNNAEIKEYTIERSELGRDIEYVGKCGIDFWHDYVVTNKRPPMRITL